MKYLRLFEDIDSFDDDNWDIEDEDDVDKFTVVTFDKGYIRCVYLVEKFIDSHNCILYNNSSYSAVTGRPLVEVMRVLDKDEIDDVKKDKYDIIIYEYGYGYNHVYFSNLKKELQDRI